MAIVLTLTILIVGLILAFKLSQGKSTKKIHSMGNNYNINNGPALFMASIYLVWYKSRRWFCSNRINDVIVSTFLLNRTCYPSNRDF